MIICARASLQLGLSSGGTAVSPFLDFHGGYVLNAAIDRYGGKSNQSPYNLL